MVIHQKEFIKMAINICLVILLVLNIIVSTQETEQINIVILPLDFEDVDQLKHMVNITEMSSTLFPNLPVRINIVDVQQYDPEQFNILVADLHCNGSSVVISMDTCNKSVTKVIADSELPLIRVNSRKDCDIPYHPYIHVYPPHIDLFKGISTFVRRLQRNTVNVFFDEEHEELLNIVTLPLDRSLSKYRLYKVDSEMTEQDIGQLLNTSQQLVGTDEKITNIICSNLGLATLLLSQAGAHKSHEITLYNVRWLVFLDNSSQVSELEPIIQLLNNVAAITIDKNYQTSAIQALKDIVYDLASGLYYFATLMNGNSSFVKTAKQRCISVNTNIVNSALKVSLLNCPDHETCKVLEAYVTEWRDSGKHLVQQNVCSKMDNTLLMVDLFPSEKRGFNGKHFMISTIKSPPFVIEDGEGPGTKGGICIELVQEMARILNFTYTLEYVPDGQYGVELENRDWTGMVGQLHRKEVDMVVAPLSVTTDRATVMDFIPFFNEYGSLLMKKPDVNEGKWKVITEPFSWLVWIGIIISVPFAGVATSLISRMVEYSKKTSEPFTNPQFSIWYIFGALLAQGGVHEPMAASGRAFIGCWWAFCVVIVASYGGSLIAYLTISKAVVPFTSLNEMVSQSQYKWGTSAGAVYSSEFKLAKGGDFKDVWDGMLLAAEDDPDVLAVSDDVHYAKVEQEHYVFISDKMLLEKRATSDPTCQLVVLPVTFLPMALGVGLQEGSPLNKIIEEAVHNLQQSGMIKYWEKKWKVKEKCSSIPLPEAHAISLVDTQSAFYCLIGGMFFAACILVSECIRYRIGGSHSKRHQSPNSTAQQEGHQFSFDTNFHYHNGTSQTTGQSEINCK